MVCCATLHICLQCPLCRGDPGPLQALQQHLAAIIPQKRNLLGNPSATTPPQTSLSQVTDPVELNPARLATPLVQLTVFVWPAKGPAKLKMPAGRSQQAAADTDHYSDTASATKPASS